ncbi:MAG: ABC transporter permease [Thermoguttaceae bacterium]
MNLWKIALRSVQHRRLASGLTALSIGLGVALVVGVMVIHGVVSHTFRRSGEGYDLIVGAKGSRLELVLNTVYHIGKPVGTLPYEYYEEFESGRFAGDVDLAVPCCVGDSYRDFRVIGTTPDMFDELPFARRQDEIDDEPESTEPAVDQSRPFDQDSLERKEETRRLEQDKFADSKKLFSQGENFGWGNFYDAVIGATVARKTDLKVGDKFRPGHGVDTDQGEEHDEFTVVGILKPTGTANDRGVFVNIEGFWLIHSGGHYDEKLDVMPEEGAAAETAAAPAADDGHSGDGHSAHGHAGEEHAEHTAEPAAKPDTQPDAAHPTAGHPEPHDAAPAAAGAGEDGHEAHEHEHQGERRVTAILVRTDDKRIAGAMALPKIINQENDAQAAMPAEEVTRLLEGIIGNIQAVLLVFAVMIVIVAGIGMMVSIYNSMSERRHEIAVMRALGARRTTVMAIILLESILLSLGGGILGIVLGHGLIGLLAPQIMEQTGVVVHALQFQPVELILIPGLIFMASIVGYLPAVIAYRTEVAESLSE